MPLGRKFDHDFSKELSEIINIKCLVDENKEQKPIVFPKNVVYCIFDSKTNLIIEVEKRFKFDLNKILLDINDIKENTKSRKNKKSENFYNEKFDISTEFILQLADRITTKFGHAFIDIEHVIFAFLTFSQEDNNITPVKKILEKYGINENDFRKYFIMIPDGYTEENHIEETEEVVKKILNQSKTQNPRHQQEIRQKFEKDKSSLISIGFIEDIIEKNKKPESGKFVGREKEIDRCIQILCRKKKKNLIIIGESGTGKTGMIDGIAKRIIEGRVPERFKNSEIYSINLGNLIAGTKYRGQFEERIRTIVSFLEKGKDLGIKIISFIDEIHTLVSAGAAEGAVNASSLLKPKLASGDIQCIGTTTQADYRKQILRDEALSGKFSCLRLEEPGKEEVVQILLDIKKEYEDFHQIKITNKIINHLVDLSNVYIKNRFFPDKAFDVLDESCSRASIKELPSLEKEIVDEVISEMTGVPIISIDNDEKKVLLKLENTLKEKIVGQDEAISTICESIRRSRIGLKDENKPIGVFLFLGFTGSGKTLVAKTLSEVLFGENKIIRLDMSEFMEKVSITKITGSSPGYVGYEEGSRFIEDVRSKPYSVILLDEIEKAHQDVLNIFLQVFDEGRLTDSYGRIVDFRNTVIIMTSNLAASKIRNLKEIGFKKTESLVNHQEVSNFLTEKAEDYFTPEFLNRVDQVIIFKQISKEIIGKIFQLELEKTKKRLKKIGYTLSLDESAINFMIEKGFSEKYGARPMARAIQHYIEVPLSKVILENENSKNKSIHLTKKEDGLNFSFSQKMDI